MLRKPKYAKVYASQICVFFLPVVLWGQYKWYKRKITAAEMTIGQEHGKEHLFEHVDALLVSGFGWD